MTGIRVGMYVLYVLLGITIVARMLSAGFHWEFLTGILFGILIAGLGAYKIALFLRSRAAQR